VDVEELIGNYPRLFHMADAGSVTPELPLSAAQPEQDGGSRA